MGVEYRGRNVRHHSGGADVVVVVVVVPGVTSAGAGRREQ